MKQTFIDDLLYMSTRYCIGRSSIGASMMAGDIMKYLNEEYLPEFNCLPTGYIEVLIRELNDCIRAHVSNTEVFFKHPLKNFSQEILSRAYSKEIELTQELKNILRTLSPWINLTGYLLSPILIELDGYSVYGFYSFCENGVGVRDCKTYEKEPHKDIYIVDEKIKSITPA